MDFIISFDDFQQELKKIEAGSIRKLLEYSRKISYCQEVLELYRRGVREHEFLDIESEVQFFKEYKQIPQTYLFYFLQLQTCEMEIKGLGEPFRTKFVTAKIDEIHSFLSSHLEFTKYVELEQKHLDEYYFTRRFFDRGSTDLRAYFRDPDFSTSHDLLLSEIRSKQLLLASLQSDLGGYRSSFNEPVGKKLQWTSQKVDLIELIYALHQSGAINNGNVSLKELVESIESFMGIDLGDYHHTFLRLRERLNPVKFLDKMRDILLWRIQDLDN